MVRPFATAWILTAAALLSATWGQEPRATVTLRPRVVVACEVITVADVAELSASVPAGAGAIVVGNAPWPGHERQISQALVRIRMVAAGTRTNRIRFRGTPTCLVVRDSETIAGDQIARVAREHLRSCLPQKGDRADIELLRQVDDVFIARAGADVELRPTLCAGIPTGRVRVDVDLVRDGVRVNRVGVGFAVKRWGQVPIARRRIARGEPFTDDNVSFVRREVAALPSAVIQSMAALRGKVAASSILPGRIIVSGLVHEAKRPWVIERNQRVLLMVHIGNLHATCLGRALQRARRGDVVRAANLSSGREVVGIALNSSTVQVVTGVDHAK